jgi:Ferric iron reductase FhuF-like transporter
VTTVVPHRIAGADLLAPITSTLRAMFGTDDLPGLTPGLVVPEFSDAEWISTSRLVDGTRLPDLLDSAKRRWQASPHAAAALAWKAYTYWLSLPVVLGWASARRVPLLHPDDVLMHFEDQRPLLTLGFRRSVPVAVLPSDPLALSGLPQVRVMRDEAALLGALRASLLDAHLTPMLEAIHAEVRVGSRTLLGSVSSGIAHGILRAADVLPGSTVEHIGTLLTTLDVEDLIELAPGPNGELTVQRKTCCLAFTLPQPKICTGCCIKP